MGTRLLTLGGCNEGKVNKGTEFFVYCVLFMSKVDRSDPLLSQLTPSSEPGFITELVSTRPTGAWVDGARVLSLKQKNCESPN